MFRRISVSLFMHWRAQNTKRGYKATLPDFHEEMAWNISGAPRPRRLEEIHSLGEFMSQPCAVPGADETCLP